MTHVRILVRYGSAWDEGRRKYEGEVLKGIVVSKEITHKDLHDELYDLAEVDPTKFDIKIRCIYEIKREKEAPPFELSNDCDLKFYILSENPLEVPLYLSFEPTNNQSKKLLNKDYNSVSRSNQVQNLNSHPSIGMDTLHGNEVDISELQSVEMNNELFDIPQQRDAPTKDCKGKGKVDYSFSKEVVGSKKALKFVVKKFIKEVLFVNTSTTSVVGDCERKAKSWVVGELIKSKFKGASRLYKPRDIIEDMRQDYDINMSYEKAWRARENAYERVLGSPEESYNLLRRYGEALKFTNPEVIYLVGNQSDWKTSEDYIRMTVLPPKVVKRVGRSKKKRISSIGEAPKLHKCSRCKQIGHNRLTCTNPISYTEKSSIQD
ncbi:MuDRA-like transposase [Cucumis melo var. makuwa]|uniref:MuDRA-like transposase n=1 Tax=Cucumis melo var. makuwa TaxID=1194695 RepID=A0A5A7U5G9_CUCMM|nr:MuDRA-like transposase [Cucumis melo var. makuwa]